MAGNSQEIESVSGKALRNKDGSITKLIEWATEGAHSPEEIMDMFLEEDIPVSHGEELTGDYVVVTKERKTEWCTNHIGSPLFLVSWNFYEGQGDAEGSEFAAIHVIANDGKFIVNDGAKGGMYGDVRKITDQRELANPESAVTRTSTAGAMAAGGLKANKKFFYNTDTKKAIPRAELNDTNKHPLNKRKESQQTWSFVWHSA